MIVVDRSSMRKDNHGYEIQDGAGLFLLAVISASSTRMRKCLDFSYVESHQGALMTRGCIMKLGLFAIMLLIASCAPSQPYRPGPASSSGSAGSEPSAGTTSGGITNQTRPATSYSQDAVDCERKAALSQAGSKGEAFASCMRSRGHTPGRN